MPRSTYTIVLVPSSRSTSRLKVADREQPSCSLWSILASVDRTCGEAAGLDGNPAESTVSRIGSVEPPTSSFWRTVGVAP